MAKYAISQEGVNSLNTLANELLINANNIVETNQKLEQITLTFYDGLGIYADEIVGVIQKNRQILNSNKEDIIGLAQCIKLKALDVQSLITMTMSGNESSISSEYNYDSAENSRSNGGKTKRNVSNEIVLPFGNGITVSQDKMNSERYFVNGNHSKEFMNYWTHIEQFSEVSLRNDSVVYIKAKDIEGIHLSSREVEDAEGFWGRRTGGTQDTFVEIAREIPYVRQLLDSGMDYNSIRNTYPELSDCIGIYFEGAPTVSKLDDFYVFASNGRHRELAAQTIDGIIPVRVTSEISRR